MISIEVLEAASYAAQAIGVQFGSSVVEVMSSVHVTSRFPGSTLLEVDLINRVVYRIMMPRDTPAVMQAVSVSFWKGEPVTGATGASHLDHQKFCGMYVPRMAKEGNTVLAVDLDTDCVLGAFLNEDFCNIDPPGMSSFLDSPDGDWRPIMAMVEEAESVLLKQYSIPSEPAKRARGIWFHLWMIGVTPEARGKRVGVKLAQHSLRWAKKMGYKLAFAECTGEVSTHILTKYCRQRVAHFIDYSEWKGPGDTAVKTVPQRGHRGLSLTVAEL